MISIVIVWLAAVAGWCYCSYRFVKCLKEDL